MLIGIDRVAADTTRRRARPSSRRRRAERKRIAAPSYVVVACDAWRCPGESDAAPAALALATPIRARTPLVTRGDIQLIAFTALVVVLGFLHVAR